MNKFKKLTIYNDYDETEEDIYVNVDNICFVKKDPDNEDWSIIDITSATALTVRLSVEEVLNIINS